MAVLQLSHRKPLMPQRPRRMPKLELHLKPLNKLKQLLQPKQFKLPNKPRL
jgi:hypothetical protein